MYMAAVYASNDVLCRNHLTLSMPPKQICRYAT